MTDVSGRSFLVTGASGALGSRVAARLGAAGAALTLTGRDPDRLVAAAASGAAGAVPATVPLDLTLPGAGERAVAAAVAAHGGLDGVVHAAGVVAFGPVDDLDDDVLDELLLLNTVAPIRLLRAALPHLRASAGAGRDPVVCHVSAVVAERALPGMAAYSASKAALTAFDAAAAAELRRAGIRVLDVRPPHTETGLAGRAIAGSAPRLPPGKDPGRVADRIVSAVTGGERDLPATAF
ncbi:MAG: SDR family NAD(P)-dependent oxidoreductase [Kineosporiaceae bacterium]